MLIPKLTPADESGADHHRRVSVPPPPRFRPLAGAVTGVVWRVGGIEGARKGSTAAQTNGLRYEAKVLERLQKFLGPRFHPQPTLHFHDSTRWRTVRPDALHFDPNGTITIFEIKIQHVPESWWQLRKLYEPVCQELKFCNRVSCVEVVRSHDPSMGYPEPVVVCQDLEMAFQTHSYKFKVLVCRL